MFPTNKIADIRRIYTESLAGIYNARESKNITFLIFQHYKNWNRFELNENLEKTLSESELLKFHFALKELKTGKPLQYVLGETEFYGLKFLVNENVLIPRPETEELVHLVIDYCKENKIGSPVTLDIGTGSGCIPVVLKKNIPGAEMFGTDVSEKALEVANKNAELNEVKINFILHDILFPDEWSKTKFDIIISNPPYIPENEKSKMHKNVTDYEPHLALFIPDNDPLLFYRRIMQFANENLNKNGKLFFEVHEDFASEVKSLMEKNNFNEVKIIKDMQGKERIVWGMLTAKDAK